MPNKSESALIKSFNALRFAALAVGISFAITIIDFGLFTFLKMPFQSPGQIPLAGPIAAVVEGLLIGKAQRQIPNLKARWVTASQMTLIAFPVAIFSFLAFVTVFPLMGNYFAHIPPTGWAWILLIWLGSCLLATVGSFNAGVCIGHELYLKREPGHVSVKGNPPIADQKFPKIWDIILFFAIYLIVFGFLIVRVPLMALPAHAVAAAIITARHVAFTSQPVTSRQAMKFALLTAAALSLIIAPVVHVLISIARSKDGISNQTVLELWLLFAVIVSVSAIISWGSSRLASWFVMRSKNARRPT